MRSGLATAAYRIVQHIVVQQGRGVEHLQRDRQILYALGLMAQQAGREHGEQGPQALAARIKNVPATGRTGSGRVSTALFRARLMPGISRARRAFSWIICYSDKVKRGQNPRERA